MNEQCLCLQDSNKNDKVAVPVCAEEHEIVDDKVAVLVCAQEHERHYPHPTPPHPTPTHWQTARQMMRLLCLCAHRKMNVITPPHPTPPVTDHEWAVLAAAGQQKKWSGCCACVRRRIWTPRPAPPRPTGNRSWKRSAYVCWTAR